MSNTTVRLVLVLVVTLTVAMVVSWLLRRDNIGSLRYDSVGPLSAPAGEDVVTLLHYFESGRRAVAAYLVRLDDRDREALRTTLRLARRAIVRVSFVIRRQGKSTVTEQASGVLVDGGRRVLTAGHLGASGPPLESWIMTSDGRRVSVRPAGREYDAFADSNRDWAILEVDLPEVDLPEGDLPEGETLPSVDLGVARKGDLVVVAGYPARLGVNRDGNVAYITDVDAIEPLVTLARVEVASPLKLIPEAGAVPLGGMSGAPILAIGGGVVGIFVSISDTSNEKGVVYSYGGSSVEVLRKALGK